MGKTREKLHHPAGWPGRRAERRSGGRSLPCRFLAVADSRVPAAALPDDHFDDQRDAREIDGEAGAARVARDPACRRPGARP